MIERAVDFSFNTAWFVCSECGDRVSMPHQDRLQGESRVCNSGHTVSAMDERPWLTDPGDVDRADNVTAAAWYHTSPRADWPPCDESPDARTTHLGTFEAAIDSMLLRMDHFAEAGKQFYLYRVRVSCDADAISAVEPEHSDWLGNSNLSQLYDRDLDVIRYVNNYEHPGSVSLKIVPSVIAQVQVLEIPLAVNESPSMREALDRYRAEEASQDALRPSTAGIDSLELIIPTNPANAAIVEAIHACDAAVARAHEQYVETVVRERMPDSGEHIRSRVLTAVSRLDGGPEQQHRVLLMLADLVHNPKRAIEAVSNAPIREMHW